MPGYAKYFAYVNIKPMPKPNKRKFLVFAIVVALGLFLFVLPSRLLTVYLSPDETAVAVAAREFGTNGSLRLADKLLEAAPWVHPRSWVTHEGSLVPVGFLGYPIIVGGVWRVLGEIGILALTPLLVLSACFPLWRFLKGLGWHAQVAGIAAWLSFPTVILYANRGLFPNLALVCLVLWSAYLVWHKPRSLTLVLAGLLFGMALAIRPVEIVWMVFWIVGAWLIKEADNHTPRVLSAVAWFAGGAAPFLIFSGWMAWVTYGTPFTIGYWLRDPVLEQAADSAVASQATISPGWPFGFHPRNLWFNVRGYLFGLMTPWLLAAVLGVGYWYHTKREKTAVVVGLATFAVLSAVYGQAIYQDHVVRDMVSLGNSFLRYLLPLAPFLAAGFAAFVWMLGMALKPTWARLAIVLVIGGLSFHGVQTAIAHDDESLRQSLQEIERYEGIRRTAYAKYGRKAIVVSDRSDKVFFPVMRTISPMPDDARLMELVREYPEPVLIFTTTQDEKGLLEWLERGFLLFPSFETKNQMLYEVAPAEDFDFDAEGLWTDE